MPSQRQVVDKLYQFLHNLQEYQDEVGRAGYDFRKYAPEIAEVVKNPTPQRFTHLKAVVAKWVPLDVEEDEEAADAGLEAT